MSRRLGRGGCRANREARRRLWESDPRCHWCGLPTRWTQQTGPLPDDAATLDHFGELRYVAVVLACYGCNQYRARLEQQRWAERRAGGVSNRTLPSVSRLVAESRAWLARPTPLDGDERRAPAPAAGAVELGGA